VPPLVHGDHSRIEHVFNNLVANAIKFSDEDSEVRVSLVYETDGPGGPTVRFSIRDFGKGISASDQVTMFQPFSTIRPGELGEGRGSGLGLSICKVCMIYLFI